MAKALKHFSFPRLCQATRQTREAAVPRQEGGGTGALAIEVETRMLEGAAARSELCLRFSEDPDPMLVVAARRRQSRARGLQGSRS